jgi:hypothetical protein
MADSAKASVPEVKAYFAAGDNGKAVVAKDLIALKKAAGAEGSGNATAYDDLAVGIGNGTLTY